MSFRLLRLEVENFAGIERAEIPFQPGLNVLHGPNDLGKSTLVRAIRAGLLLQFNSSEADRFRTWSGGTKPKVELEFELTRDDETRLYRVTKHFDRSALLEKRLPASQYRKLTDGRDVDAVIREELLPWGIQRPGKGAQRGLPNSFLATVLLGPQDDVDGLIRDTSLGDDDNDTARDWLTNVLEASAVDPFFAEVQSVVEARYAEAYTETGRERRTRDAPLRRIAQRIVDTEAELQTLDDALDRATHIEAEIDELTSRQLTVDAELEDARRAAEAADARAASRARRDEAEARVAETRKQRLAAFDVRERAETEAARVAGLEDATVAADAWREAANAARDRAAAVVETARDDLRDAQRAAEADAEGAARRELESRRDATRNQLDALQRKIETIQQVQHLSRAHGEARMEARRHETRITEIDARLEGLAAETDDRTRARLDLDARIWAAELRRAELELAALDARREAAVALTAAADAQTADARRELDALAARDLPDEDRLDLLRKLAGERREAHARLQVGLDVELEPSRELTLTSRVDDDDAIETTVSTPLSWRADGRLEIEIDGVGRMVVAAGSADDRAHADALDARWDAEATPVLRTTEADDLDALAALVRSATRDRERLRAELASADAKRAQAEDLDAIADARAGIGRTIAAIEARIARRADDLPDGGEALRARVDGCLERQLASDASIERTLSELEDARQELVEGEDDAKATRQELTAERNTATALMERAVEQREETGEALRRYDDDLVLNAAATMASAEAEQAALGERLTELDTELADLQESGGETTSVLENALEDARAQQSEVEARRQRVLDAREALRSDLAGARRGHELARDQVAEIDFQQLAADETAAREALDAIPADEPDAPSPAEAARQVESLASRARELELQLTERRALLRREGGATHEEARRAVAERLEALRATERQLQLEYQGWQLLQETMRAVQDEETANLGAAVGPRVAERFAAMASEVGGRDYDLDLGSDFASSGIVADGAPRDPSLFSLGTREQLATLYRLTLAERLGSALVLDDQLVQSDPERMAPLSRLMAEIAERIQILVFTCRAVDYRFARNAHTLDLTRFVEPA